MKQAEEWPGDQLERFPAERRPERGIYVLEDPIGVDHTEEVRREVEKPLEKLFPAAGSDHVALKSAVHYPQTISFRMCNGRGS